jgi:hypothetical protein
MKRQTDPTPMTNPECNNRYPSDSSFSLSLAKGPRLHGNGETQNTTKLGNTGTVWPSHGYLLAPVV